MSTVLRIVPGKFGDRPVRLDATHPLYAQSVAPEAFKPVAEKDSDEDIALGDMTKAALVAHAESLGLSLDASAKKADILAAIEAHGIKDAE